MSKARFEAALFEGHKGVTAVLVPFDPEEVWGLRPVKLARRDGTPEEPGGRDRATTNAIPQEAHGLTAMTFRARCLCGTPIMAAGSSGGTRRRRSR